LGPWPACSAFVWGICSPCSTLVISAPDGALNSLEFEIVGTFQTFSRDYDAHAMRINLAAAQDLLATPGVNTLALSLTRTEDTGTVAADLRARLAGRGWRSTPGSN
jgi:putative ABC transport system permease protein